MAQNEKKFQPDRKFFTICIYAIITTIVCTLFIKFIWNWKSTKAMLSGLVSSLSPFLMGFFIAYIMGNLMISVDKHFYENLLKVKSPSLRKGLSLLTSYLIVFIIIVSALFYIIPSFISSIASIAGSINDIYNNMMDSVNSISQRYPNPTVNYIQDAIQDNIPQYLEYFKKWAADIAPNIANASMSFVKWIFNFIVAIIVSIYMLLDKNILTRGFQRVIYSIFDRKKATYMWNTVLKANDIFSGFIIGKTIDSLIIGCLCLILMKIFSIGGTYALFISIFVGLTNMIPYFGPFIGAIPSALIILLSLSPKQAIAFVILIIVLQQFDGNVLGPYILGDKTGLRPIWIIFAITIGGWLGGIVGMFLGVPCVAVIADILNDVIERKLKKHNIDLPPITVEKKESKLTLSKVKKSLNVIRTKFKK